MVMMLVVIDDDGFLFHNLSMTTPGMATEVAAWLWTEAVDDTPLFTRSKDHLSPDQIKNGDQWGIKDHACLQIILKFTNINCTQFT